VEKKQFQAEALYIMPTWKDTVLITVEYLKSLGQPVALLHAKYNLRGSKNHCHEEINILKYNALANGAIVMVLTNYVVEPGIFNGTIRTIVDIVYESEEGPRKVGALPLYLVVDAPDHTIPEGHAWDPAHPTWIPVPIDTMPCKRKCCSVTAIPLWICKAITIYKSQRASVGDGQAWKKLACLLPSAQHSVPGLEQVAISRATGPDVLMINEK
jgi:hypothetical protein